MSEPLVIRVVAPLLALTLAACASAVSTMPADTLLGNGLPTLSPALSATVQPGLAIERWWLLFDDPELARLIEQAMQDNHDLAIAAARLREARAQLDDVRSARLPSLDLQVGSSRSRQSADAGLPPGAERTTQRHSVSLAGSYDVDLWGRLASGTGRS